MAPLLSNSVMQAATRVLVLASCLSCSSFAFGDVSIGEVRVGLDGMAKPGQWTRLEVELTASEATTVKLEAVSPDPSGNPVVYPGGLLHLKGSQAESTRLFFQPGRLATWLLIRAVHPKSGVALASRRVNSVENESAPNGFRTLKHAVPTCLIIEGPKGDREAGWDSGILIQSLADRGIRTTLIQDAATELPDSWRTLVAYGTIILSRSFDISAAQSDALRDWVRQGGHLVVVLADEQRHQQQLLETFKASPVSEWMLSAGGYRSSSVGTLGSFETFAASSISIPAARRGRIQCVVFDGDDGDVLARENEGVLLIRRSYGFGRVTLSGVAIDLYPVSQWRELDSFVVKLTDISVTTQQSERRGRRRISHTGVTELPTQLLTTLEQFPRVSGRSTLSVLGFLLLYLLAIGPIDYVIVHRLLKRPRLTWISFPAMVLGAGLVSVIAAAGSNSDQLIVNNISVVDMDVTSRFSRQTVLAGVFSPNHARYKLGVRHHTELFGKADGQSSPEPWTSWLSYSEGTYGGMYRSAGVETGRPAYSIDADRSGFENIPIPVWSDRMLVSEVQLPTQEDLFEVSLKRAGTGHLHPSGRFTHHLPFPIADWILVYGNRVYYHDYRSSGEMSGDAATIKPGEPWSPDASTVTGREIRSFLTGASFLAKSKDGEYVSTNVEWNSRNLDVAAILQVLTFHESAGGSSYTGLTNSAMSHMEFSKHLPLDRAILCGRIHTKTSSIEIDGQPAEQNPSVSGSFIRILLPVDDAPADFNLPDFGKK